MFSISPLYLIGFWFLLAICIQSITESPAGIVFLAFLLSLTASHYYFKDQASESFQITKKNIGSELYLPYTTQIKNKFENWITILYMMIDFSIWTKFLQSFSKNKKKININNFSKYKIKKFGKKKSPYIKNFIENNFWLVSKIYTSKSRSDISKIQWNSKTLPSSKVSLWQIF